MDTSTGTRTFGFDRVWRHEAPIRFRHDTAVP